VGWCVGVSVGTVGLRVGTIDVGSRVGKLVKVGTEDGSSVVGEGVLGVCVGVSVGLSVGVRVVGQSVGKCVGMKVGTGV
jgi:phosphate/sulfate permease